jgi:hypothetical protein
VRVVGDVARALEHHVLEQVGEPGEPAVSFAGPTWYQRLTATIGTR